MSHCTGQSAIAQLTKQFPLALLRSLPGCLHVSVTIRVIGELLYIPVDAKSCLPAPVRSLPPELVKLAETLPVAMLPQIVTQSCSTCQCCWMCDARNETLCSILILISMDAKGIEGGSTNRSSTPTWPESCSTIALNRRAGQPHRVPATTPKSQEKET